LELDLAEQNQGLHRQIIMQDLRSSGILCSIKSSFIINALVQPIGPIYRNPEIQKGEESTTEVNGHSLLFWDFVYCLIFYVSTTFRKLATTFQKLALKEDEGTD